MAFYSGAMFAFSIHKCNLFNCYFMTCSREEEKIRKHKFFMYGEGKVDELRFTHKFFWDDLLKFKDGASTILLLSFFLGN